MGMDVNYCYCGDHFATYPNIGYAIYLKLICFMSIIPP